MYILNVLHRKSMKHEIESQRIEFIDLFIAIDRAATEQKRHAKWKTQFYKIAVREYDNNLETFGKTFYYASNCVGM